MMTSCEKCVYYPKCYERIARDSGNPLFARLKGCNDFKDKNTIIELPCKVGDTLYTLIGDEIDEKTVIGTNMCWNKNYKHITVHTHNHRNATTSWELSDFGKTVFLTREEAEKALAKL